jgi:MFS family permease
MAQQKTDKALELLKKVAKINKRKMGIITRKNLLKNSMNEEMSKNEDSSLAKNRNLSGFNIFIMPRLRKRSLVLAICWFFLFTCYHTNTQNTSNLGKDIYTSFTYGALVEIPATLIVFLSLDRIGRRWPMSFSMIIAGTAGLLTLLIKTEKSSATLFLISALIMRVSLATEYNIIIQYSTEVFPTVLRGRSLAFLRFMGTLGLYLSPSIVYLVSSNFT